MTNLRKKKTKIFTIFKNFIQKRKGNELAHCHLMFKLF